MGALSTLYSLYVFALMLPYIKVTTELLQPSTSLDRH